MACTLPRHLGKKYPVTEGCMLQRCFVSFQRANVGRRQSVFLANAVNIPSVISTSRVRISAQSIQLIYVSLHHA